MVMLLKIRNYQFGIKNNELLYLHEETFTCTRSTTGLTSSLNSSTVEIPGPQICLNNVLLLVSLIETFFCYVLF